MGFEGLSAITTFNTPKLKRMSINHDVSNLGVLYAIAMYAEKREKVPQFYHPNEFIKRDFDNILTTKIKFC